MFISLKIGIKIRLKKPAMSPDLFMQKNHRKYLISIGTKHHIICLPATKIILSFPKSTLARRLINTNLLKQMIFITKENHQKFILFKRRNFIVLKYDLCFARE